MSDQTEELKNENISVVITRKPGLNVALDISVSPKAVDSAYSKAIKNINKEVSIPGFRKGKAPDQFVIKNFGKQLQGEWREVLLNESFDEALKLAKIRPFKNNSIRTQGVKELALHKPAVFSVEFEASPTVPSINIDEITLKRPGTPEIKDIDIDKVVDNLRFYYAEWSDVADHGVQNGDFVDLDIDKLDEPQERLAEAMRFEVADGKIANWMRKLILGLRPNESVEGISENENESDAAEFIPTQCRITVKAIKQVNLPPVNDELALRMGLPNVEELRNKISDDLKSRAQQESYERLRSQLDEWLLENYTFEVPESVMKEEVQQRLANNIAWLEKNGAPADAIEKRKAELQLTLPEQVQGGYRLFFLLLAFAQHANIQLTKEEVADELAYQITKEGLTLTPEQTKDMESRVAQQIFLRRSRDYIIDRAKYV